VAHHVDLCDFAVIEGMVDTANNAFEWVDMLFSNAGFALDEPDWPLTRIAGSQACSVSERG
jgi:NADP-dependent 3-hydroxy acid dehydrogenase YdfG